MKRILLAVTGLSPQVLTETLYALAVPATPGASPWIPDEVHLITTGSGKTTALFNLLHPETGWFHRLLRDYRLPLIHFDASCIHVIHHADGTPLEDIRGIEDNHWAADTIIRLVRRLTENPESELHVSLAGGRKTMGFYAGYALSLFGRPQDRMSHVLVSEPFEGKRDFYYPTPYDHAVTIRVGDRDVARNARDATIDLADIPFVPLRQSLPDDIFSRGLGYAETVQAVRDARPETAHLAYCPERTLLIANGREVRVTGPQMVIHLLATARYRAAQSRDELLRAPLKGIPDRDWTQEALHTLTRIPDPTGSLAERVAEFLGHPNAPRALDGERFSPILSNLNKRLKRELGAAADAFVIHSSRRKGGARYFLKLPPSRIDLPSVVSTPSPRAPDRFNLPPDKH